MTPLSAAALLDVWERAAAVSPVARPLAILAAAEPGCSVDALGVEPLGRRDARLSALRASLRGSVVEATAACPGCGEDVEARFDQRHVWDAAASPGAPVEVEARGWRLVCRPLTTADLVAAEGDLLDGADVLFERCVSAAWRGGERADPADAPPEVRDAVEQALADADPAADVVLALVCPSCGEAWDAPFDLAAFVWAELDFEARRVMREVDVLARAYGWREPDILRLSPWRRRRYLELVFG